MPYTFSKVGQLFPTFGCTYISIHMQGDLHQNSFPKCENIITFKNVCRHKNEDSGCHVLVCGVVYVRAIANDGQHPHPCNYLWPQNNQSAPKVTPKSSMYQYSWTKIPFLKVSMTTPEKQNWVMNVLWTIPQYLWIILWNLKTSSHHKHTKLGQLIYVIEKLSYITAKYANLSQRQIFLFLSRTQDDCLGLICW